MLYESLENVRVITDDAMRQIKDLLLKGMRRYFKMTVRLMEYGGVGMEIVKYPTSPPLCPIYICSCEFRKYLFI